MDASLTDIVANICKVLQKHSVEYLIIGGTAVALHGYLRMSTHADGTLLDKYDLDFWYNPTYDNYFNLLNALTGLGYDVKAFFKEKTPNPQKSFFRFESDLFTIDFLPQLKGRSRFAPSFNNKGVEVLNDTEIWFIGYEDLISEKMTDSRPKDLVDIEELKIRKAKDGGI